MDAETQRAVIITLGSIVVALIGLIGARRYINRAPANDAGDVELGEGQALPASPLEKFSGTGNELVAMVLEDSRYLRREIANVRESSDKKHEELRVEIEGLRTELGAKTLHQNAFERAIRHYLAVVVNVVESLGGRMPAPDPDDAELLDPILPTRQRTTT